MRTKSDLATYAADLEVEIAYLERDKAELRERLDEALEVIQALSEDQHEVTYLVTNGFSQPHPGYVC
jgi:chaperonin cofactor prefoldin